MMRGSRALLAVASKSLFFCTSILFAFQMNLIFQVVPGQEMSQVQKAFFAKGQITFDNQIRRVVLNEPSPIEWDAIRYLDLVERYP